jgi:uncharacterized protein (TIGR02246 family)
MEDIILSLEKEAMERWRQGDPGGFIELSADEISYIDPGLTKPIVGLEAFRDYLSQFTGKVNYQRSEFIDPQVVEIGDAALLTYNYRSSVVSPEGEIASQTPWNATEVYARRGGAWKIVHTHWSYTSHRHPEWVEVPIPVESLAKPFTDVLGELMALERGAMERWRKGDPWGFMDLYAPDMTYFDPGTTQRRNGRAEMAALYAQVEGKIFYDVMDFVDPRVQVYGDLAVLAYRFLSTWLNQDGSVASRVGWNCSEVYERMEGGWKVIHNHWSLIRGERV